MEDIQKYLEIKPYPHDKRCGCSVCPDCRPQKPCEFCSAGCAVCNNVINPGPQDINSVDSWIAPTEDLQSTANFLVACKRGDLFNFRKFIETGASVMFCDEKGKTPLHYVCDSAGTSVKMEMARVLIIKVFQWEDLYLQDDDHRTPLEYAIQNHSMDIVKMLLFPETVLIGVKADVLRLMCIPYDSLRVFGQSLIHWACDSKESAQLSIANLLAGSKSLIPMKAHLLFGSVDSDGNTAFLLALKNDNLELAKLLINEHNAYSGVNNLGQTALHVACGMSSVSDILEIFRIIVKRNRKLLDAQDNHGDTPLHYIAKLRGFENDIWYEKLLSIVIVKRSSSPRLRNSDGQIPLHLASSVLFAKCMIDNDCCSEDELHLKDKDARSPLHCVAIGKNVQLLKFMLSYTSAGPNCRYIFDHDIKIDGRHLIHWLLLDPSCHDAAKILLLSRKVPLDMKLDEYGLTLMKFLFSKPEFLKLTDLVIFKRSSELSLRTMIDHQGNSPLHIALLEKDFHLAWLLSSHEPSLCSLKNDAGELPIHIAAKSHTQKFYLQFFCKNWIILCSIGLAKKRDLCSHLLEMGSVFDCEDGFTSPINSVRQIDEHGVACSKSGDTPLHIACAAGNDVFVHKLLVEFENRCLSVNITNNNLQTSLVSCCASEVLCHGRNDSNTLLDTSKLLRSTASYKGLKFRFESIAAALLKCNTVSVCQEDFFGVTALQYACRAGLLGAVKIMLGKISDNDGRTMLMRSMFSGQRAIDHLCDLFNTPEYLDADDKEIVKNILMSYVTDLQHEEVDGLPIFVWACVEPRRWDLAEILLSIKGELVGHLQIEGVSLLEWAVSSMERNRLARILLVDRQIPIDGLNIHGIPLLEWACCDIQRLPLAKLLILGRQYPVEELQRILVLICRDARLAEVAKLLLVDRQVPLDESVIVDGMHIILWSITCTNSEIARMIILDRRIVLNHLRIDNTPLLIWVCQKCHDRDLIGRTTVMKAALSFLLQRADIDRDVQDEQGDTALHFACRKALVPGEQFEIVNLLLCDSGDGDGRPASVNVQNNRGNTALHDVCATQSPCQHKHRSKLISLLLKRRARNVADANLNIRNASGNTALHLLCDSDMKDCVETLLQFNLPVNFNLRNENRMTVFNLVAHKDKKWKTLLTRAQKRQPRDP